MSRATTEPQVWRLDATGVGLRSVGWQEPDQEVRGTADITPDGTRASLRDLALVPGRPAEVRRPADRVPP